MAFAELGVPVSADDLERAPIRCANPKFSGPSDYYWPCGRCHFCRERRARDVAHRIDLEASLHPSSAYVTLTYADDQLPAGGALSLRDMTLFLKRLRKAAAEADRSWKLRYYYVGEYAPRTLRPHYHVVLYGYPGCHRGRDGTYNSPKDGRTPICCDNCKRIAAAWTHGRIVSAPFELTRKGSTYLSLYVLKGGDRILPPHLPREFAKWSLGLGAGVVDAIAKATLALDPNTDRAPRALRYDELQRPLGAYLRGKLNHALGISEAMVKLEAQAAVNRQITANRAARSHGTSPREMGARLSAKVLAARKKARRK